MFLDDRLHEIFEEHKDKKIIECTNALIDECVSRIPNPEGMGVRDWINSIKQVDASWQLFCKKNPIFNHHGFRNVMMIRMGNDTQTHREIYNLLGWDYSEVQKILDKNED